LKYRRLEIVLFVLVQQRDDTEDINPEQMSDRVLAAVVPHPDSVIATDLAGESVSVIVNEYTELEEG
jgi:CO dehydrogenase nickel-insertion accessory protein CooC1